MVALPGVGGSQVDTDDGSELLLLVGLLLGHGHVRDGQDGQRRQQYSAKHVGNLEAKQSFSQTWLALFTPVANVYPFFNQRVSRAGAVLRLRRLLTWSSSVAADDPYSSKFNTPRLSARFTNDTPPVERTG